MNATTGETRTTGVGTEATRIRAGTGMTILMTPIMHAPDLATSPNETEIDLVFTTDVEITTATTATTAGTVPTILDGKTETITTTADIAQTTAVTRVETETEIDGDESKRVTTVVTTADGIDRAREKGIATGMTIITGREVTMVGRVKTRRIRWTLAR